MRIAYVVTWDLGADDALTRKVRDQVDTWVQLGHEARVFGVSPRAADATMFNGAETFIRMPASNPLSKIWGSRRPFSEMRQAIDHYSPDLLYMRAQPWKRPLSALMGKFPSAVEINSPDLVEGKMHASEHGFYQRLLHHYNRMTRGRFYGAATGFVSVTEEMLEDPCFSMFDKPGIAVPNGIVMQPSDVVEPQSSEGRRPALVLIGTGGYSSEKIHWQAVDKVIGLAWKTRDVLDFHLIGNDLIVESQVPDNVTVHGWLQPEETRKVFARSDVGIGTLGLHRKDMNEACPLKVRDYAAAGLPIIVGYEETAFLRGGVPDWALQIPNDEGNLLENVAEVVAFAERWKGIRVPFSEAAGVFGVEGTERMRLNFFEKLLSLS